MRFNGEKIPTVLLHINSKNNSIFCPLNLDNNNFRPIFHFIFLASIVKMRLKIANFLTLTLKGRENSLSLFFVHNMIFILIYVIPSHSHFNIAGRCFFRNTFNLFCCCLHAEYACIIFIKKKRKTSSALQ
jgi:hypothetical protein